MKVRYNFWLTEQRMCDFEITQDLVDDYNANYDRHLTLSEIETIVATGEGALSTDGMSEADILRVMSIYDEFIDWLTDEAFNSEENWILIEEEVQDWERKVL